jgi:PEP-CTERM motif
MKPKLLLACTCLGLFPAISFAAPTVYSYTGELYSFIEDQDPPAGTYTTSMKLVGSLTLSEAIAPNSNEHAHGDEILNLSFNDGRIEYNKAHLASSFLLSTGSTGNIIDWIFQFYRPNPTSDAYSASAYSNGVYGDIAGVFGSGTDQAETLGAIGSWTVTPVPEPSTSALFIAGLALVGFGSHRRRRLSHLVGAYYDVIRPLSARLLFFCFL